MAVDPNPTGFEITTFGVDVYPLPPSSIEIDVTDPLVETTEVAEAPTFKSWDIRVTLFWKLRFKSLSFWESNIGLTLSTYNWVEPTLTDLIIFAEGTTRGSYNDLSFATSFPLRIISSVCLFKITGLSKLGSPTIPGP